MVVLESGKTADVDLTEKQTDDDAEKHEAGDFAEGEIDETEEESDENESKMGWGHDKMEKAELDSDLDGKQINGGAPGHNGMREHKQVECC